MKRSYWLGLLIALSLLGVQVYGAQAQQPVVYVVLFFSPSCGHCHYVITEVLPPLQEEYGEQLQLLYVDVSQPQGSTLFYAAFDALNVPEDRRGYVPTLAIGTTALVGGSDIPEQLPGLIRQGMAAGGIDLPAIPGLREAYEASIGALPDGDGANAAAEASSPISTTYKETTWRDRLNQDRVGNSLAIGVLSILVIGLASHLKQGVHLLTNNKRHVETRRAGQMLVLALAIITTVIAGTLAFESGSISLPAVLAGGVTFGMVVVTVTIIRANRQSSWRNTTLPAWVLPLIALLGLVVAGYLAYVEVGENEAVCGAVGDCNTVQQSDYATLFGLIPIGVLGVAGYVMILMVWVIHQVATDWVADAAQALLLGFALFGTVFSSYLTFLEPFVIGATCAWCLTSAMLMILILSLQAPAGWIAVNRLVDKLARSPGRRSPSA